MRRPRRELLHSRQEGQEERHHLYEESAGQISIVERSMGPVTSAVFGMPLHRHRILVEKGLVGRLVELLGGTEGEGTTVSLARYFEEGHCLLDLEDAMDRAGLPYAYEAQRSGYVIFRPSGEELRLALDA